MLATLQTRMFLFHFVPQKYKNYVIKKYNFSCCFNLLNAELNLICHLLALLGNHHILHVSEISVIWVRNLFLHTMEIK